MGCGEAASVKYKSFLKAYTSNSTSFQRHDRLPGQNSYELVKKTKS